MGVNTKFTTSCHIVNFCIYTHPVNSKHIFRNSNIFLIICFEFTGLVYIQKQYDTSTRIIMRNRVCVIFRNSLEHFSNIHTLSFYYAKNYVFLHFLFSCYIWCHSHSFFYYLFNIHSILHEAKFIIARYTAI